MEDFYVSTLEEHFGPGYKSQLVADEAVIPYEDLRHVAVLHWGFDGKSHQGELIVHRELSAEVVEIFQELYERRFPIEKMRLVSTYGYSDDLSMADNNSSGFNYRTVLSTGRLSWHAFGCAIDINPLVNPYILSDGEILPVNGSSYTDRNQSVMGMIHEGSDILEIFQSRGWTWGGEWEHIKDYHHFEKPLK